METTLSQVRIIEYTTVVLYKTHTDRIWVSKRINPEKEFYNYWQSPGGHIEKSDISAKWATQ
jgi:8-oxo-dGTP pyrophosphatase MutT (NUDIX family)